MESHLAWLKSALRCSDEDEIRRSRSFSSHSTTRRSDARAPATSLPRGVSPATHAAAAPTDAGTPAAVTTPGAPPVPRIIWQAPDPDDVEDVASGLPSARTPRPTAMPAHLGTMIGIVDADDDVPEPAGCAGCRCSTGQRRCVSLSCEFLKVSVWVSLAGALPAFVFPIWLVLVDFVCVPRFGMAANSVATIVEGSTTNLWHILILWLLFGETKLLMFLLRMNVLVTLGIFVPYRVACEVIFRSQTPTSLRIAGNLISLAMITLNAVLLARHFSSLGPESHFAKAFVLDDGAFSSDAALSDSKAV